MEVAAVDRGPNEGTQGLVGELVERPLAPKRTPNGNKNRLERPKERPAAQVVGVDVQLGGRKAEAHGVGPRGPLRAAVDLGPKASGRSLELLGGRVQHEDQVVQGAGPKEDQGMDIKRSIE